MSQKDRPFSFPDRYRLKSSEEFAHVFQRKRSASDEWLIVYACENGLELTRVGLSVSRKVGNAVMRNKIKRLYREAFRLSRPKLPVGLDLVLIPRKRGEVPTLECLLESLPELVRLVFRKLKKASPQP